MTREVPAPESIPSLKKLAPAFAVVDLPFKVRAAIDAKSHKMVERLYGPLGHAPHGFTETFDFLLHCRERDARTRIARCLKLRMLAKRLQRRDGLPMQEAA